MTSESGPSRRSFIQTASAALSAPLAAAAVTMPAHAAPAADPLQARLDLLEDTNAIRGLNQALARYINAGAEEAIATLFADPSETCIDACLRHVTAHAFGEQDVIEVAADRRTAAALVHCTVRIETAIEPSCPLVEMARAQGGGVLRHEETGVLENVYARRDGAWKILRATYRRADAGDHLS